MNGWLCVLFIVLALGTKSGNGNDEKNKDDMVHVHDSKKNQPLPVVTQEHVFDNGLETYVISAASFDCRIEITVLKKKIVVHFGNDATDINFYDMTAYPELNFTRDGNFSFAGNERHWCDFDDIKSIELDIFAHFSKPCGMLLKLNAGTKLASKYFDTPNSFPGGIVRAPPDPRDGISLPHLKRLEEAPRYGQCLWVRGDIVDTNEELSVNLVKGGTGMSKLDDAVVEKVLLQIRIFFEDNQVSVSTRNGDSWETGKRINNPSNKKFDFMTCFERTKFLVLINGIYSIEQPYSVAGYEPLSSIHHIFIVGNATVTRLRLAGDLYPAPVQFSILPQFKVGQTVTVYGQNTGPFYISLIKNNNNYPFMFNFFRGAMYLREKDNDEIKLIQTLGDSPISEPGTFSISLQRIYDRLLFYIGDELYGNFSYFADDGTFVDHLFVANTAFINVAELHEADSQ